jgi:uncharacterized protein (DUF2267 family)
MNEADFVRRVQTLGALPSREEADRWAMATLHGLSELLGDADARRHFLSQLPGTLKARLVAATPHAYDLDRDAFVQRVGSALGVHAPEGERAARIVYRVLREAVSPGQIAAFEARIPKDIVALLEQPA